MPAPLLFVSHGSPDAVGATSAWRKALEAWGRSHRPTTVIVMSAHSSSRSIVLSSNPAPALLHGSNSLGPENRLVQWTAQGDPALATRAVERLERHGIAASEDPLMGLDHGAWIPLHALWPEGGLRVVAASVPRQSSPATVYEAGRALSTLRDEGVMLIGAGNLVHNPRGAARAQSENEIPAWVQNFEDWVFDRIRDHGDESLFHYRDRAPAAHLAVSSDERIAPLFFVLGARRDVDSHTEIFRGFHTGTISLSTIGFE